MGELKRRFPEPGAIETEADKKGFAKLLGEYLRLDNLLQNYDEFTDLKNRQTGDNEALSGFQEGQEEFDHGSDAIAGFRLPSQRYIQDCLSAYNDIRDWTRREKIADDRQRSQLDWDVIVFEVELLRSQEINLDYILEQIFEKNKSSKSKSELIEDARRMIRASIGHRAKESLLVDFINQTDLGSLGDKTGVIEAFFSFAQKEQGRELVELIAAEDLNAEPARRYIATSLRREFASESGTELNSILPQMNKFTSHYLTKKQTVLRKVSAFVEKFKGVGGQL